jgi:hypothetical protein
MASTPSSPALAQPHDGVQVRAVAVEIAARAGARPAAISQTSGSKMPQVFGFVSMMAGDLAGMAVEHGLDVGGADRAVLARRDGHHAVSRGGAAVGGIRAVRRFRHPARRKRSSPRAERAP